MRTRAGVSRVLLFALWCIVQVAGGGTAIGQSAAGVPDAWKTPATWEKVKNGMTPEQVRAILGSPTQEMRFSESMMNWTYGDAADAMTNPSPVVRVVGTVTFLNGKVEMSSFVEIPAAPGTAPSAPATNPAAPAAPPVAPAAEPTEPKIPPAPQGVPGWFIDYRWQQVKGDMTLDEVRAWLGEPTTREFSKWEYVMPGLYSDSPIGTVTFNPDRRLFTANRRADEIALLETIAQACSADAPRWLNPSAWATIRTRTDWTFKTGFSADFIESLMGPPASKGPDYGGKIVWTYTVQGADGDPIDARFEFDDFNETRSYTPPDWKRVQTYLASRALIEKSGPQWTDIERWRRITWALDAGLQHNWAEYSESDEAQDVSKLSSALRLGNASVVEQYLGTPTDVSWAQVPSMFGASEWVATLTYASGAIVEVGTGDSGPAKPERSSYPWIKKLVAAPAPGLPSNLKRHPAWTDEQWRQAQAEALQRATMGPYGELVGTLKRLAVWSDPAAKTLAVALGQADSIEVSSDAIEDHNGLSSCRVISHHGNGSLVWSAYATADQVKAVKSDPSAIFNLRDLALVEVHCPPDLAGATASTWPVFSTPAADDLERWKLIAQGDSVRWVKYLLGEPAQASDNEWRYGPWIEKRLHTGTVYITNSVRVSATAIPAP